MTALIIIGSILALLLLLLLVPLSVEATAKDGVFAVRLRVFFFSIPLYPPPPKKEKKPPETPPPEPEKEPEKKPPKSLSETLGMVRELLQSSRKGLGILRRHLVLTQTEIYICVGGEDAHQIALAYGKTYSAVLALLDLLGLLVVLRKPKVGILPDFTKTETRYDCALRLRGRPLFILAAAGSIAFRFFRLQRRKPPGSPQEPAQRQEEPAQTPPAM